MKLKAYYIIAFKNWYHYIVNNKVFRKNMPAKLKMKMGFNNQNIFEV